MLFRWTVFFFSNALINFVTMGRASSLTKLQLWLQLWFSHIWVLQSWFLQSWFFQLWRAVPGHCWTGVSIASCPMISSAAVMWMGWFPSVLIYALLIFLRAKVDTGWPLHRLSCVLSRFKFCVGCILRNFSFVGLRLSCAYLSFTKFYFVETELVRIQFG